MKTSTFLFFLQVLVAGPYALAENLRGVVTSKATNENDHLRNLEIGEARKKKTDSGPFWAYFYEENLYSNNTDTPYLFIGADGEKTTVDSFQASVSKLRMFIGDGSYNDEDDMAIVVGMYVEFSDGSFEQYGRIEPLSMEHTFEPGETIVGNITVCGTGLGTGVGYYGFQTSTGALFEAGSKSFGSGKIQRNEFHFDADGHVLTGFYVMYNADSLTAIGTKVMKQLESVLISNVQYQGFVNNAEIPTWGVEKKVDSKFSYNSGSYAVQYERAQESVHSFTSETANFMKAAQGTNHTVIVETPVPEIDVGSTDTRTWETSYRIGMGKSSNEIEMESLQELERITEEIEIHFDANRTTVTTITQVEYPLTYEWTGKEKYIFKDGTEMDFDTHGSYSGVLVSDINVRTISKCVDGSELVFGICPGEPNYEKCHSVHIWVFYQWFQDARALLEKISGVMPWFGKKMLLLV